MTPASCPSGIKPVSHSQLEAAFHLCGPWAKSELRWSRALNSCGKKVSLSPYSAVAHFKTLKGRTSMQNSQKATNLTICVLLFLLTPIYQRKANDNY